MTPSMRIITWNCCRRTYANAGQALASLCGDFVFLQEVGRPASPDRATVWAGTNPRQGVLVAAVGGRLALQSAKTSITKLRPVAVSGSSPFMALNVWAQRSPSYVGHVNRTLSRFRRVLAGRLCVIAGDFNSEGPQRVDDKPHHTRLVGRLRDEFGVVSAYHHRYGVPHGREPHPTYYHQRHRDNPWHIDFCFIPQQWASKIVHVEVLDGEPWSTLSDHRPLLVDVGV